MGGEETGGKGKEAGTTVGQDYPLLGVSCLPHASHLISATANRVLSFPIMIYTHIHTLHQEASRAVQTSVKKQNWLLFF